MLQFADNFREHMDLRVTAMNKLLMEGEDSLTVEERGVLGRPLYTRDWQTLGKAPDLSVPDPGPLLDTRPVPSPWLPELPRELDPVEAKAEAVCAALRAQGRFCPERADLVAEMHKFPTSSPDALVKVLFRRSNNARSV